MGIKGLSASISCFAIATRCSPPSKRSKTSDPLAWFQVREEQLRWRRRQPTCPRPASARKLTQPCRRQAKVRRAAAVGRAQSGRQGVGFIALPERAANVCFGGRYRDRLFMAASHSIYSLYVNTQGVAGG